MLRALSPCSTEPDAPAGRVPVRARTFSSVSKTTSSRWYLGAWVVWVTALALFFTTAHETFTASAFYAIGTSPVSGVAWLVAGIASIVMWVVWIGALIHLGQQHRSGWVAALLVLQLVGLGIIGMLLYTLAGPHDVVVHRPTVT